MTPVVFDFDKTLTYRDTTLPFFAFCAQQRGLPLILARKILWYFLAVFVKIGLVSNIQHKNFGVQLFLKDAARSQVQGWGRNFAKQIRTNRIYREIFPQYPNAIISSASLEDYLKPMFPNHRVVASKLEYSDDDLVVRWGINNYGDRKKIRLEQLGISQLDVVFTDSYSDRCLMKMASTTFLVSGDDLKKIDPS